jgi:hypothetical protein
MALLPPPKGNGFLCHKIFMKSLTTIMSENGIKGAYKRTHKKNFNYRSVAAYIVKEFSWDRDRSICLFLEQAYHDDILLFINLYDTCQSNLMNPQQTKNVLDCLVIQTVDWGRTELEAYNEKRKKAGACRLQNGEVQL